MHVFDPKLSITDNCRIADDLSHAAWQFAGEGRREEYRNSGSKPQRTAWLDYERLQILEAALVDGELLAFGVLDLDPDAEFRLIPKAILMARDLRLDDGQMTIEALGRTFREVRICRANPERPASSQSLLGPENALSTPVRSKAGRKDTYPLSAIVLRQLFQADANRYLSAERLHPKFRDLFASINPDIPAPSVRTLRSQLQRFRQELAKISNN